MNEQVVLDVDPRSVLSAIKQANQAVEGWEKNTVGAGDKMQKSLERMAEMLLKVNDKSRNSMERLTQSIEKQAAAYGKSGVEKLVAERDRLIKKLGDEQGMIERVTKSYEKMIAAESGQGSGFQAIAGNVKSFIQAPMESAGGAVSGLFKIMGTAGMAVSLFVGALTAVEGAGLAATSSLAEYGVHVRDVEIRTGLAAKEVGQFSFAAKAVGQDVSIFERTMRGLTEAVDDNSEAGDKARKALEKLGVAPRDAEGQVRPTADLLNDLSKSLNEIPNAIDRNKAGMDIFKKAWVEMAPAVLDLSQNLEHAKALGLGPSESDVERWVGYKEKLTESEALWDRIYRKLKEGIAGTIWIDIKTTGAKWILDFLGGNSGPTSNTNIPQSHSVTRKQMTDYIFGAVADMGDANSGKELSSYLKNSGGIEAAQSQLSKLKKAYDEARTSAEQLTHSPLLHKDVADQARADVEKARTAYESQKALVDSLKPKSETEAQKLAAKGDTVYVIGEGATQTVVGVNPSDSIQPFAKIKGTPSLFGPGNNGIQSAITGEPVYKEGMQNIFTPGVGQESVFISPEASRNQKDYGAAAAAERLKGEGDLLKRDEQFQISSIEMEHNATIKLLELRSGKGGDIDLAREAAAIRQDALNKEYAITGDIVKLKTSSLQNELDTQVKIAEIEQQKAKQQEQQIHQHAETLAHTLLTKPGQFGKQLGSTVRDAALKPVEGMMADAATSFLKPLLFGSGNQDPMRVSTDANTRVTQRNTDAMDDLTSALRSRSYGGGPDSGGVASSSGGSSTSDYLGSVMPSLGGFGGGGGFGGFGPGGTPPFVAGGSSNTIGSLANVALGGGQSKGSGGGGLSNWTGNLGKSWDSLKNSVGLGDTSNFDGIGDYANAIGKSKVAGAVGGMLATNGLINNAGTWKGTMEGTAGGAMLGYQAAGPFGAAVGASIGLEVGLFEKLAGVETPENEAKRLVKQQYGVSIDTSMAKQIVSIAQQKYSSHVSVAVRDPDVRKMLMLYAQGTGQKMPLSATTPEAGSLAEVGGKLYQQATYQGTNGTPYTFQSSLPVLGNLGGGNYASPGSPNVSGGSGPTYVSLNIGGSDTANFMTGQFVTPQFVQDQSMAAQNSSYGRTQQSANMQLPGLTIA